MGYVHKQRYAQSEIKVLRRLKPGSYETKDGRFAVWSAGVRLWFTYDATTGEQYATVDKHAAVRLILGIRSGVKPPAPVPPSPRPAAPDQPDAQAQLQLVRPGQRRAVAPLPKIASVLLVEVGGVQEVLGWDVDGGVRRLWSASPTSGVTS